MNPLTRLITALVNPPYPLGYPPMLTQTAKLVHGAFLPRDSQTDNRFAWRKKFYQRKASLELKKPTTEMPQ